MKRLLRFALESVEIALALLGIFGVIGALIAAMIFFERLKHTPLW